MMLKIAVKRFCQLIVLPLIIVSMMAGLLSASQAVMAADTGAIVLTITKADARVVTYTMADLDKMPQSTIETTTPWYDQAHKFSGPRLTDVLAASKATGTMITVSALNDYLADLPTSDATSFGVILATRIDGKLMPVRDKGPIFIIYPYQSDPQLQHDIYYNRSVWQVAKLTVK